MIQIPPWVRSLRNFLRSIGSLDKGHVFNHKFVRKHNCLRKFAKNLPRSKVGLDYTFRVSAKGRAISRVALLLWVMSVNPCCLDLFVGTGPAGLSSRRGNLGAVGGWIVPLGLHIHCRSRPRPGLRRVARDSCRKKSRRRGNGSGCLQRNEIFSFEAGG